MGIDLGYNLTLILTNGTSKQPCCYHNPHYLTSQLPSCPFRRPPVRWLAWRLGGVDTSRGSTALVAPPRHLVNFGVLYENLGGLYIYLLIYHKNQPSKSWISCYVCVFSGWVIDGSGKLGPVWMHKKCPKNEMPLKILRGTPPKKKRITKLPL